MWVLRVSCRRDGQTRQCYADGGLCEMVASVILAPNMVKIDVDVNRERVPLGLLCGWHLSAGSSSMTNFPTGRCKVIPVHSG